MKPTAIPNIDPQTSYAAQNAREGLINVADLGRLTGVDVAQLNKFAKMGSMAHYGEYHGKRFYNFQEIINWLHDAEVKSEAKPVIWEKMAAQLQKKECPYALEKTSGKNVRIVWKDFSVAA